MRQILADLALSQVAHKRVEYLNMSEARRLSIGTQLVRDPGMYDEIQSYYLLLFYGYSQRKQYNSFSINSQ